MTDGSRRESDSDGALPGLPAVKLLMAAFRRYSSSTARRLLDRRKNQIPPRMADMASTPITTPAAMPAVLGPFEAELLTVAVTVAGIGRAVA